MLVYERESILVMNYRKHKDSIIERLLKITEKVSQLREVAKRIIWKSQAKLNRKFKEMKT